MVVNNKLDRPIFVAEMTINHLGMRKIAIAMMERLKEVGADFVKFKSKDVVKYYKDTKKKFGGYDFLRYRKSLELSPEDFEKIDKWSQKNKLPWFATVHDSKSLDMVSDYGVPYLKIASSDSQNLDFVKKVVNSNKKNRPLVVSTGGSDLKHISKVVEVVSSANVELFLLHCVSIYPSPLEKCNVKFIKKLKEEFADKKVKIGYSGHERGWLPTLMAIQAGAEMVERHVTLTRNLNIHHIEAALTIDEFETMIKEAEDLIKILNVEGVEYYEEELEFIKKKDYS